MGLAWAIFHSFEMPKSWILKTKQIHVHPQDLLVWLTLAKLTAVLLPGTVCKVIGEVLLGEKENKLISPCIRRYSGRWTAPPCFLFKCSPPQVFKKHSTHTLASSTNIGVQETLVPKASLIPSRSHLNCQLSSFVSYHLRPTPKVMAWTPLPLHSNSCTLTPTKILVTLLWAFISLNSS